MHFAYADPPYPGQAKRHYKNDPSGIPAAEVDHAALVAQLERDYPDGWALSTGSTNLKYVLSLCPDGARVGAWVKPYAVWFPGVNPSYAWEPVIFRGGRKRPRHAPTVADWISANAMMRTGTHGTKPAEFNYWILGILGVTAEDTLADLFPGSGGMGRALAIWQRQMGLPLETIERPQQTHMIY